MELTLKMHPGRPQCATSNPLPQDPALLDQSHGLAKHSASRNHGVLKQLGSCASHALLLHVAHPHRGLEKLFEINVLSVA